MLSAVGSAEERIREDPLRALRALRFHVVKKVMPDAQLWLTITSDWLPPLMASVSVERRREELHKMFKYDTVATINVLSYWKMEAFTSAIMAGGLWLKPTTEL